jgi:hypothetical protein
MKRTALLVALLVVGLLFSIGGTFFAAPDVVSAVSDDVTAPASSYLQPANQLIKTSFIYEKKIADGSCALWQAYGKGRAIFAPNLGAKVTLRNEKGEVFQATIVRVFTIPPGSNIRGETWVEFKNLTPARGQPGSGPAVIFAFWRL